MTAVSIAQVAELAGVSTATVSRALSGNPNVSDAARRAVHEAADQLGYVVSSNASSLASGRTRNVGVITPFLDRWYFTQVLEGAQLTLLEAGYDTTLYNVSGGTDLRERVFENALKRQRVDGLIAVAVEPNARELERLQNINRPVIGVGGAIDGIPSLALDDVTVAKLGASHLTGLGHRRIGYIGGGPDSDQDFHLPTRRFEGFELAMREAGLAVDPVLALSADFTIEGGYRAAKQLLGLPATVRPTAVFAVSDEMAIGAIMAARDLGLSIPHDVSIAGIDNFAQSEFFGLTTVAQSPHDQGILAARNMLSWLETGERPAAVSTQPHRLIVRSSTARPAR